MDKRKVTFSDLITLIKNRSPFSILGVIFLFSSIFILLPSIIFISNSFVEPYEKYDFEKIEQNGTEKDAEITYLSYVENVTINGEHPLEISFEFSENGVIKSDKFQTLDLEKTYQMQIGDNIKIKTFENQSKIQDLEPFTFPFYMFYILPFVFLILGSSFFLTGFIPALKEYNLYKNGIVKEGTIISLIASPGLPITNIGKNILINYYYLNSYGQRMFGESKTIDYSIMVDKKPEDKIKLFVSETDETKSCIVPKLEAMKNNWIV